jgi:acetoin utilization deacetylase AcuC-like enzyme
MRTRLYEHPIFLEHITPAGHPERPDRLRSLNIALEHPNFHGLDRREAPQANEDAVLLAHPEEHLRHVMRSIPEEEGVINQLEADTYASVKSLQAALTGVGGAIAAVDDVFSGAAENVFVASRPPGHHAEKTTAMGFCFFNNAAIAARHAQRAHGATRVAIMDFDVHHGNGSQAIFWDDPTVLYASTHEMPLYPGTGAVSESGSQGTIVNAPLRAGDGGEAFRQAMEQKILPAIDDFAADLLIISAGFDAHRRDPLANLNFVEEDYDWATARLMEIAGRGAGGRVVSVLEGGYDLQALSQSVAVHVHRMMHG